MIDDILSRLKQVKATKPSHWQARCPSHQDHKPSLSITELDDGRVLLKCWAGCTAKEITNAVGLNMRSLYPQKPEPKQTTKEPVMSVWEARRLSKELQQELTIIAIYQNKVDSFKTIRQEQRLRAIQAGLRSNEIKEQLIKNNFMNAYVRNGKHTAGADNYEACRKELAND